MMISVTGFLPRARNCIRALIVFIILLLLAYWLIFNRIGQLNRLPDGDRVLIIGRVVASKTIDPAQNVATYEVADPTGQVWCVSKRGAPLEDAIVIIWATKTTSRHDRVLCREQGRAGTF